MEELIKKHKEAVKYLGFILTQTKMGGMHRDLLRRMMQLSKDTLNHFSPEEAKKQKKFNEKFGETKKIFGGK